MGEIKKISPKFINIFESVITVLSILLSYLRTRNKDPARLPDSDK